MVKTCCKYLICLLILFFNLKQNHAQNIKDSLLNELKNARFDTTKVRLYNELTRFFSSIDAKQAHIYSKTTIELAEKINDQKGLGMSYHNLGNIYLYANDAQNALKNYSTAMSIRENIKDKKGIAATCNNMANIYQSLGENEKAIQFNLKSLAINQEIGDRKGEGYSYYNIGGVLEGKGDYNEAVKNYKMAMKVFEEISDEQGISYCFNSIGIIYSSQGNFKAALEYFLKSLTMNEKTGDKNAIAFTLNNIGIISEKLDNDSEALKYYDRTLKIKEELGDKKGIADVYNNKGLIHSKLARKDTSHYTKALNYYKKSLEIQEQIKSKSGIANSYQNIGQTYKNQKKYHLALDYYYKSYEIRQKFQDKKGIAFSCIGIGSCLKNMNQASQALTYLLKAQQIGQEMKSNSILKDASEGLAAIYEKLGNYQQAFKALQMFKVMSDSLKNEEDTKKNTQMLMQYEFDKKQGEQDAEQKRKEYEHRAQMRQQRILTGAFIFGFVLFLVLAIVIFRSYKLKQKDNNLLESKKKEIEIQMKVISEQNKNITDSIQYAKRIQSAIIPPEELILEKLPQHFIFYRPKDIVSGDFYWFTSKENKTVLVAADCTGHGVPGAFMSMLGVTFLHEIVNKNEVFQANLILNHLREFVKKSLRQTGRDNEAKDGMDISLMIIDFETSELQFSGAYNSMYIIRKKEIDQGMGENSLSSRQYKNITIENNPYILFQIEADRMPIGIYMKDNLSFTNHVIKIQKDDTLYFSSDGYVDQLGGPDESKFMVKKFKQLLLKIQDSTLSEQKDILEKEFDQWKGSVEQLDDVLVMGVKF